MTPRVVVVGGGFAGVRCARALRRRLPPGRCEIVLFNGENHMVFHPLLAEVAGSSVGLDAVAAPLRQMLRGVSCRSETVVDVDLATRHVVFESGDGSTGTLPYDHVVLACGRAVSLAAVPGMADHAFAFKTAGDALALRAQVIQRLEQAEVCPDPERRRALLSFVVVGGGFSGVEVAGEINDLVRGSRRFFPAIPAGEITVTLVHAGDAILPEVAPGLRAYARRRMERAGVTVLTGARAALATASGIRLADGRFVPGGTLVCTIGTSPARLVARMEARKENGALVTAPDLRLLGEERAWAIGDCARIANAATGGYCPTTGQFAERQGRQAAANIARALAGEPTKPFAFRPLGQLCAIGGRDAVAEILGFRLSGFPAWFVWRGVYLAKMPSWARRVKVGVGWAWELLFARDLLTLRVDPTERISRAHFQGGDWIYREGDAATSFFAIESGEVEVVRSRPGGDASRIAQLGAGEWFGEMALLENRPRSAGVRALGDVEVTVLGAQVFSRLSRSLAPLHERLVESMRRRRSGLPESFAEAHAILNAEPLTAFVEPAPPEITADRPLSEAVALLAGGSSRLLAVVDPARELIGILTPTDLLRAVDAAASIPPEERRSFTVGRFMTPRAIAVTLDDTPGTAAERLWTRGLKRLPVVLSAERRRVVGSIRTETLLQAVVRRAGAETPDPIARTAVVREAAAAQA